MPSCSESPRARARHDTRAQTPALLKGLIFGPTGRAMTPTHTRKGGKLYRYYVSTDVLKRDARDLHGAARAGRRDRERGDRPGARPAALAGDHRRARGARREQSIDGLSEAEVRDALQRLDPLWDELFPAEQARIVQLLVERVDVGARRGHPASRRRARQPDRRIGRRSRHRRSPHDDARALKRRQALTDPHPVTFQRAGRESTSSSRRSGAVETARPPYRQRPHQGSRPRPPLAPNDRERQVRLRTELANAEKINFRTSAASYD